MSRWLEDYAFDLPPERIAQRPSPVRDHSRLLVVDRRAGEARGSLFRRLAGHLERGDLLVLNDSAVLPARLRGRKAATGGRIELLLTRSLGGGRWKALMGGKAAAGSTVDFGVGAVKTTVVATHGGGEVTVRFDPPQGGAMLMEVVGMTPLPPYIKRDGKDGAVVDGLDERRYQTIYASAGGSVAAPTAGLHFTERLFRSLDERGVERAFVTLHVGPGTFRPLRGNDLARARLDSELAFVPAATAAAVARVRSRGGRVVAVGTTVTRTLESFTADDGSLGSGWREVDLLIRPGYRFRTVDALVTNFHLPRSSLLLLVCAFGGRERVLGAYRRAVTEGYRFYSYGDAMLLV